MVFEDDDSFTQRSSTWFGMTVPFEEMGGGCPRAFVLPENDTKGMPWFDCLSESQWSVVILVAPWLSIPSEEQEPP